MKFDRDKECIKLKTKLARIQGAAASVHWPVEPYGVSVFLPDPWII